MKAIFFGLLLASFFTRISYKLENFFATAHHLGLISIGKEHTIMADALQTCNAAGAVLTEYVTRMSFTLDEHLNGEPIVCIVKGVGLVYGLLVPALLPALADM